VKPVKLLHAILQFFRAKVSTLPSILLKAFQIGNHAADKLLILCFRTFFCWCNKGDWLFLVEHRLEEHFVFRQKDGVSTPVLPVEANRRY